MDKAAILLITCDELNKGVLGYCGGQAVKTPQIDSLAKEGTNYGNCYTTSPWCLPARCSILTGLYPHHSGAYSNFRKCALDNGLPNLFTSMKEGGYHTSVFGKCHFAPVPYSSTRPDRTLPYDDFKAYYKSLGIEHLELEDDKQVSVWFYDDYSRELEEAGYLTAYREAVWNQEYQKVFPFPGPSQWHPDAWVGRKAAEYIRQYDCSKPLFTWISFSGPHYTFDAPEEYLKQADTEHFPQRKRKEGELEGTDRIHHDSYFGGPNANIDGSRQAEGCACKNYTEDYWKRLLTSYCANIKLIDDQVGEILRAVSEKYGDNAMVLFSADHGEMLGNHGLWGKHNCAYDEVWRIPLLIRYPGQKEAKTDNRLVNSTDFLPTCLDAAQLPIPPCDGRSLRDPDWSRNYTFAEGEGFLAVTDGKCKYIHVQKGTENARELLDLEGDPNEYENKAMWETCQAKRVRMQEKLIEHLLPAVLA